MTVSWKSETPPEQGRITPMGWLRVGLRGIALAILVFGCLLLLLLVRLIERPICGVQRPVTPFITMFVCRNAFRILSLRFDTKGARMHHPGIIVANHTSWLDIFALNARKRIYFVSKSEVAAWPGIGWLARATGTVFIERDRKKSNEQKALFAQRLKAGHKLLFFPEGTSTDGLRVLPFKTTLFASLFEPELRDILYVQPVSVVFHAPKDAERRYYGWWGDMDFGSHLLKVLATQPQGRVELTYHAPVAVQAFQDRKALAAYCEQTVRKGHMQMRKQLPEQR